MREPVRRVRLPLKSSGPVGVASRKGRNSASTRSSNTGSATLSTITAPSRTTAAATSSGPASLLRRVIGTPSSWTTAAGTGNSCRLFQEGRPKPVPAYSASGP